MLTTLTVSWTLPWRMMRPRRCSMSAAVHAGSRLIICLSARWTFRPVPPFLVEVSSTRIRPSAQACTRRALALGLS